MRIEKADGAPLPLTPDDLVSGDLNLAPDVEAHIRLCLMERINDAACPAHPGVSIEDYLNTYRYCLALFAINLQRPMIIDGRKVETGLTHGGLIIRYPDLRMIQPLCYCGLLAFSKTDNGYAYTPILNPEQMSYEQYPEA